MSDERNYTTVRRVVVSHQQKTAEMPRGGVGR